MAVSRSAGSNVFNRCTAVVRHLGLTGGLGSIAAIRCEADFLRQVLRAQLLRVALQPVV